VTRRRGLTVCTIVVIAWAVLGWCLKLPEWFVIAVAALIGFMFSAVMDLTTPAPQDEGDQE
jgi:uncharacterized membrane protein